MRPPARPSFRNTFPPAVLLSSEAWWIVHNFHFNPYSRAAGWRAYVSTLPDSLSCEGVLISVTRLSTPPTPPALPRPLINRNKSRLLYVTRDGCTFISLFMRYNLTTWAGVINADTHSDAGSLLDNSTTARLYAQPQAGLTYIVVSLFTKETARRGNHIPQLSKCRVLSLSVSDEPPISRILASYSHKHERHCYAAL